MAEAGIQPRSPFQDRLDAVKSYPSFKTLLQDAGCVLGVSEFCEVRPKSMLLL